MNDNKDLKQIEELDAWKNLYKQLERDYKCLKFAVHLFNILVMKTGGSLTKDEEAFTQWSFNMGYVLDTINNIEFAYRDYKDYMENL